MQFWLGTHRPNWLAKVTVPLMVSRRTLGKYRTLPVATCDWVLDSGGFSELSLHGKWTISSAKYAQDVGRFEAEVGRLQWAAPMDWMCEPWILEKTGLSVREHQARTIDSYLELKGMGLPVIPVLQGWVLSDYLRHVEAYDRAGVRLEAELVGLGSVCRRQHTGEIEDIVLALRPLRLHGFGVKASGLRDYGYLLESADSMAWSYAGRRSGACNGSVNCANHLHYALEWRDRLLHDRPAQLHLEAARKLVTE